MATEQHDPDPDRLEDDPVDPMSPDEMIDLEERVIHDDDDEDLLGARDDVEPNVRNQ